MHLLCNAGIRYCELMAPQDDQPRELTTRDQRDGSRSGLVSDFDPHGNLVRERYFENGVATAEQRWLADGITEGLWFERAGDSLFVEWVPSGEAKSVCEMKVGLRDGPYVELHPSGATSATGYFTEGERSGDWVWFDESGKQVGTRTFHTERRPTDAGEGRSPEIDWHW